MTVVVSLTSVFVSQPPLSKPPPRGPTFVPPKMPVSRRMKVDLPQPESAATPMRTTPPSAAMVISDRALARTFVDFRAVRVGTRAWAARARARMIFAMLLACGG